ncbi:MAG: DUF748 domain-containing protein [Planctomycetota bacterium]|nr:MAG: DUF748 domain-containing protein [Planctomycetota bacterium]
MSPKSIGKLKRVRTLLLLLLPLLLGAHFLLKLLLRQQISYLIEETTGGKIIHTQMDFDLLFQKIIWQNLKLQGPKQKKKSFSFSLLKGQLELTSPLQIHALQSLQLSAPTLSIWLRPGVKNSPIPLQLPRKIFLHSLKIQQGTFQFEDRTLRRPCQWKIKEINLETYPFYSKNWTKLLLLAKGSGRLAKGYFQIRPQPEKKLSQIWISKLPLKIFSPYLEEWLPLRVEKGQVEGEVRIYPYQNGVLLVNEITFSKLHFQLLQTTQNPLAHRILKIVHHLGKWFSIQFQVWLKKKSFRNNLAQALGVILRQYWRAVIHGILMRAADFVLETKLPPLKNPPPKTKKSKQNPPPLSAQKQGNIPPKKYQNPPAQNQNPKKKYSLTSKESSPPTPIPPKENLHPQEVVLFEKIWTDYRNSPSKQAWDKTWKSKYQLKLLASTKAKLWKIRKPFLKPGVWLYGRNKNGNYLRVWIPRIAFSKLPWKRGKTVRFPPLRLLSYRIKRKWIELICRWEIKEL